jgi:hypothetical protein
MVRMATVWQTASCVQPAKDAAHTSQTSTVEQHGEQHAIHLHVAILRCNAHTAHNSGQLRLI